MILTALFHRLTQQASPQLGSMVGGGLPLHRGLPFSSYLGCQGLRCGCKILLLGLSVFLFSTPEYSPSSCLQGPVCWPQGFDRGWDTGTQPSGLENKISFIIHPGPQLLRASKPGSSTHFAGCQWERQREIWYPKRSELLSRRLKMACT